MDVYFAKNQKDDKRLRHLLVGMTFILASMIDDHAQVFMITDAPCPTNLIGCVCLLTGRMWYLDDDTKVIRVKPAEPRVRFIPEV